MSKFTVVDAFCGAGGLSLGLQESGFSVLVGFDNDPRCIATLKNNEEYISHDVIEADIRALLGGRLRERIDLQPGELDLLAGGPPCQGFSVQRTIGGDHDDRNLLVDDYGDLIQDFLPKYFLMENVPGLRGKRGKAVLQRFEGRLQASGYFIHKRVIDAQHYGVPQRRNRLILIGEKINGGQPLFTWPKALTTKKTVRDIIGHLPEPPNDCTEHPGLPGHRADRLSALNKQRLAALKDGQGRTELPRHLLADCHQVSAEITGHRSVYGRMAWDEVAPTITARFDSFTRGKFGHPEQIRSISLLEGALLQTFPADYRFSGSKVEVARQIGNAVPPRLAKMLGQSIIHALQSTAKQKALFA